MSTTFQRVVLCNTLLVLLIIASTSLFSNKSTMGYNWTFPYFSGAANFENLFQWEISPSDFENVKELENTFKIENYIDYKHQKTDDTILNTVNNYGYVLVAAASRNIFPFMGDLRGVIYFQLITHTLISLIVINFILLKTWEKYFFIIFYAANPLIIYFVTFPYYYFWMFIPSFFTVVLILKEEWRNWWVWLAIPVLLFSILIRPTTLFLTVLFFVLAFLYARSKLLKVLAMSAFGLFLSGLVLVSPSSNTAPWHTVYIGVGGYPNDVGVSDLADEIGFEYFYSQTQIKIDTNAIKGNWNDPSIRQEYMDVLQRRYYEILMSSPLLLLRNAFANTLQVFSIGYIDNHPILTWASTLVGFFVLIFLIYSKQLVWILAIFASAVSFSLYFPPIPAYNFAAYLLLVCATINGINCICCNRNVLLKDLYNKLNFFRNV